MPLANPVTPGAAEGTAVGEAEGTEATVQKAWYYVRRRRYVYRPRYFVVRPRRRRRIYFY